MSSLRRLRRERRRGGVLLVGSGARYGGGAYMATYSGAKAFELCSSESLWAELRPHGVDVLHLVLTTSDTPAFRKLLADKGKPAPRGLAAPQQVARLGLNRLAHGPHDNGGQLFGPRAGWRRLRTRLVSKLSARLVFGPGRTPRQAIFSGAVAPHMGGIAGAPPAVR